MEVKPAQTADLGRGWRNRKSTDRQPCEIILNMIWFVTHYVTNQNPYKKTAMQKHSGLFVVRPTGFEPAAFRVGELWQTDLNGVTVLLLDEVNKL